MVDVRVVQRPGDLPILVRGRTIQTPPIAVPGIGTGAAYASGDAMGTIFEIPNIPRTGIIQTAILYDLDDEGLETDLVLASAIFVPTADNSAFSLTDVDVVKVAAVINWPTTAFRNFAANQVAISAALGMAYTAPLGKFFCQMVTRGAPNITAANIPLVSLVILGDE